MLSQRPRRTRRKFHMARVHGICVEKNYQLSEDNPVESSKEGVFYWATK